MHVIETAPKAELHLHIEGSIEPEMALRFAHRNGLNFKFKSVDELLATYEFQNLEGFIPVFQLNASTLVTERDFYELTYAYVKRARRDNVRHMEIAMAPQGATHRGVAAEAALDGVLAGLDDAKRDFDVTGGIILGCQRHRGLEDGLAMLRQVKPYRDRILALGLASMEVGYPPAMFERLFAEARDFGWRTVAHAGEEGPPEYIWQALDVLKVDRVDHGVRCEEDPALVSRLAEEQIPLTVCPMSNIYLKVFPTIAEHNIARLLRAGLMVTVNSDDPPYFGGYVNVNYTEPARHLSLSKAELFQLARNSFKASFIEDRVKDQYVAELDAFEKGAVSSKSSSETLRI